MYRQVTHVRHFADTNKEPKEYLKRCTKPKIRQLLASNGQPFGSGTWTKAHLIMMAHAFLVANPAYLYRIDSHSRDSQAHRAMDEERIPLVVQERIDNRRLHRQDIREANFRATVPSLPSYQLYENTPYMSLPSEDEMRDQLQMFIDATGNDALEKVPCMSCGGRFFASLCKPGFLALDKIPNAHLLRPEIEHPLHVYTSGLLLEPTAVSVSPQGTPQGTICLKCYGSLSSKAQPTNSLARGLWLGDVPDVIKQLTLAERILIQLAFPRAYLVKLQPKKRTNMPPDQLFDGISGSVCSVKMPADEVIQMLEGKIANKPTLPNPPLVLAHTISIAYLGFGKTPPLLHPQPLHCAPTCHTCSHKMASVEQSV